ncbi:hypothetical protein STENM223S_04069 [Streptomyces tendae]
MTSDMPPPSPPSAMAWWPSASVSERWMWQELPSRWLYLAMKVRDMPSCAAISLAPVL